MKDISIITDTKKFKYRVNGIIIHNNCILTLKMKNNISYCFPGGHVELGEDSHSAIIREMKEETNTLVSIVKELAIVENFYLDKHSLQTHEISFYFIVKPRSLKNISLPKYISKELDKNILKTHNFEWLDIRYLKDYDLKPDYIKEKLTNNNLNFEHIILKNNL